MFNHLNESQRLLLFVISELARVSLDLAQNCYLTLQERCGLFKLHVFIMKGGYFHCFVGVKVGFLGMMVCDLFLGTDYSCICN